MQTNICNCSRKKIYYKKIKLKYHSKIFSIAKIYVLKKHARKYTQT